MLALVSGGAQLVTRTFTSSQSFTVPLGVSNLETVSGKGQDGTPAYTTTQPDGVNIDSVAGSATGTGVSSGSLTWADFQSDLSSALSQVNSGGTGTFYGVDFTAYPNSNTYTSSLVQRGYVNAVTGSASIFTSPGWKTSGPILSSDSGYATVSYTRSVFVDATTGASSSGFGKTFPGGAGGPATTQNFTNVAVTGGSSYSIVVPSGGSITITYYQ